MDELELKYSPVHGGHGTCVDSFAEAVNQFLMTKIASSEA